MLSVATFFYSCGEGRIEKLSHAELFGLRGEVRSVLMFDEPKSLGLEEKYECIEPLPLILQNYDKNGMITGGKIYYVYTIKSTPVDLTALSLAKLPEYNYYDIYSGSLPINRIAMDSADSLLSSNERSRVLETKDCIGSPVKYITKSFY